MEMSLLSWLALLAFYMLYILLGGCMFSHIEHQKDSWDSEEEAERSREIKLVIVDLLAQVLLKERSPTNITSVLDRIRDLSAPKIHNFSSKIKRVGYGRIALETQLGRGVCLIYSTLGVPLNAILIGTLGSYFGKKTKQIVGEKILLNVLIAGVPGIAIFILLPSALFWQVEANWTYLDSVYYAFINMTHIGFGDLINVHRDQEVAGKLGPWMWAYRAFTVVWLVLGLGYMFMITEHLSQGQYLKMLRKVSKKISKRLSRSGHMDNNNGGVKHSSLRRVNAFKIRSKSLHVRFPQDKARNKHQKLFRIASV